MKPNKFLTMCLICLFSSSMIFAQNVKDMTKEEWQSEMNLLTGQKASLIKQIDSLKNVIAGLVKTRNAIQSYDDCINDIYTMLGSNKQGVDNFRNMVNDLSSRINSRSGKKADLQAELDMMKKNKISALPEFFETVQSQLQRKLDAWIEEPEKINYSVISGDCLWNIAKKKEHYANPFAWPVIYKANREQIKNPDLIFPKQIFNIPRLTDDEMAAYDKIRRNYKPAPPTQSKNQIP